MYTTVTATDVLCELCGKTEEKKCFIFWRNGNYLYLCPLNTAKWLQWKSVVRLSWVNNIAFVLLFGNVQEPCNFTRHIRTNKCRRLRNGVDWSYLLYGFCKDLWTLMSAFPRFFVSIGLLH